MDQRGKGKLTGELLAGDGAVGYSKKMENELGTIISRLDRLSWGFRIEKLSERGCEPVWEVFYVSPIDKVWRTSRNETLIEALTESVLLIEGQADGTVSTLDTQTLDEDLVVETSHGI